MGAKFHTPEGSKKVRQLLEHYGRRLKLHYLPGYSPECMPTRTCGGAGVDWLWEDGRDLVTHNLDRTEIKRLERDSDNYFARCARNPQKVLRTIGSPFADRPNRRT
jgi:hypothetical protein